MIHSPLTKGATKLVSTIMTRDIIAGYEKEFDLNVNSFFNGISKLELLECLDSGYQFFYPLNVQGDAQFYRKLSTFPWYYIRWKWEHQKSLPYIKNNTSILEIGCGSGSFLKEIKERFIGINLTGLEITINDTSETFILHEKVEEHSQNTSINYDVVCMFQVLEHISDVASFLNSSVKILKTGGHLIISVPNNSSIFFSKKNSLFLNMPPHHMGLWNPSSLAFLTEFFPLELVDKYYEPVQDYHFKWFQGIIESKLTILKSKLFSHIVFKKIMVVPICKFLSRFYHGHSVMFVYKKL